MLARQILPLKTAADLDAPDCMQPIHWRTRERFPAIAGSFSRSPNGGHPLSGATQTPRRKAQAEQDNHQQIDDEEREEQGAAEQC
jgi:hypothetical protein